jgi:hypothetical protein
MKILKKEILIKKDVEQILNAHTYLKANIIEGRLYLWYMEDVSDNFQNVIVLKETGQDIDIDLHYIDTVIDSDGTEYHLHFRQKGFKTYSNRIDSY